MANQLIVLVVVTQMLIVLNKNDSICWRKLIVLNKNKPLVFGSQRPLQTLWKCDFEKVWVFKHFKYIHTVC